MFVSIVMAKNGVTMEVERFENFLVALKKCYTHLQFVPSIPKIMEVARQMVQFVSPIYMFTDDGFLELEKYLIDKNYEAVYVKITMVKWFCNYVRWHNLENKDVIHKFLKKLNEFECGTLDILDEKNVIHPYKQPYFLTYEEIRKELEASSVSSGSTHEETVPDRKEVFHLKGKSRKLNGRNMDVARKGRKRR